MMLIPYLHHLQKGPLDLIETGKGLKVQTDKPHLVSLGISAVNIFILWSKFYCMDKQNMFIYLPVDGHLGCF